jgi:4-hydroxy-tetrahydrodipicolinate synthase
MVSAPFAAELTDADLFVHFSELAERLDGDLVVYNNPVFGVDLSPALLERITRLPSYASVKQGTKGLAAMVEVIARVQATGQAQVLAAADLACAAAVGAGAGGVTSTNVWVFPQAFLALADPAVAPAHKAMVLAALHPYAVTVRELGQPRAVKAAMVLRGYAGTSAVRRPYLALTAEEEGRLKSVLAEVDERLLSVGSAG